MDSPPILSRIWKIAGFVLPETLTANWLAGNFSSSALADSLQDALPKIDGPADKPTKVVSDFETPPKSANTKRFTLLNGNRACQLTL